MSKRQIIQKIWILNLDTSILRASANQAADPPQAAVLQQLQRRALHITTEDHLAAFQERLLISHQEGLRRLLAAVPLAAVAAQLVGDEGQEPEDRPAAAQQRQGRRQEPRQELVLKLQPTLPGLREEQQRQPEAIEPAWEGQQRRHHTRVLYMNGCVARFGCNRNSLGPLFGFFSRTLK